MESTLNSCIPSTHHKGCKGFIGLSQGWPWGLKKTEEVSRAKKHECETENIKKFLLLPPALTCDFSVG